MQENPEIPVISAGIREAAEQLRWLLDRGYPKNPSIKLVGDRHRMDKSGRQILYRGVFPVDEALRRRARLVGKPYDFKNDRFAIDGHNVVLTVANFLHGVPVFESDDGLIRDIGALHGRLHTGELMFRSLDLVAEGIDTLGIQNVFVAFDAPLSHSRTHAGYLRDRLLELLTQNSEDSSGENCSVNVVVANSADQALKSVSLDVLSTSDSPVIDAVGRRVFDLARFILESRFNAHFESLA